MTNNDLDLTSFFLHIQFRTTNSKVTVSLMLNRVFLLNNFLACVARTTRAEPKETRDVLPVNVVVSPSSGGFREVRK